MKKYDRFEVCLIWQMLVQGGALEEPEVDYGGMLEGMEAADLLSLLEKVQERLRTLGVEARTVSAASVKLFIDKRFTIRMDSPDGRIMPLRPLVKALFILFLRHPEGILLKQRDCYRQELEEIYGIICPNLPGEVVRARIGRLVNLQDNSFSEKASVLNARLEEWLPERTADNYKIQGFNGHPRRIPLSPLMVEWM